MRALLAAAALVALPLAASAAGDRPVLVAVEWEYRDFGAAAAIHEVAGRPRLWQTRSVERMEDVPAGPRIEGSAFRLAPGRWKRFVVVIRNETAETLYFYAEPHTVDPPGQATNFGIRCLCIDHAFNVWPGQVWYRVVEIRLPEDFEGEKLTVRHALVGIDAARAETFMRTPTEPAP